MTPARTAVPVPRAAPRAVGARGLVLFGVLPLALLAAAVTAGVALGARPVPPGIAVDTLAALARGQGTPPGIDAAAVASRVPRTATAALVGAALAVAGAALQGATRNPLGDPGLLGLSAGASLAAAAGIGLGLGGSAAGIAVLAAVGTLAAAVLVYAVAAAAARAGGTPGAPTPIALVLAGAAVTAGCTAATTALIVLSPTVQDRFRFWAIGTVARADLGDAALLAPAVVVGVLLAAAAAPGLDALALGDDLAHGLGRRPTRTRAVLLAAVVLLTGAAVALAGPVGFVGLVVPHALRRLRPATARALVLGCALWGAVLVVVADVFGRVLLAPAELHLGVTTAALGVPVLLALLRRPGVGA